MERLLCHRVSFSKVHCHAQFGILSMTTEFHGMDPELLQKALQLLVKRGKAQIFGSDDQQGIKFT